MSAHAVLRLSGHRLRLVPFPPYRISRLPPGEGTPRDSLHMVRLQEGEVRQFELRPGAKDAPPAELTRVEDPVAEGAAGLGQWVRWRMGPTGAEVRLRAGLAPRMDADGSLLLGPDTDAWKVETSLFRCPWPEGLVLASTEEGAPGPFEFHGPQDAVLFLQGPLRRAELPPIGELAGEGQHVLGTGTLSTAQNGAEYVDVAYAHAGEGWRQRHVLLPLTADGAQVLVLTAQAREAQMPALLAQAEELVRGFEAGRPAS